MERQPVYGGALYAVRTAAGKYSVHEVNGPYTADKTLLVSPRAFCRSPFDPKEIFIGGHDSSNKISDNLAWIFPRPYPSPLGSRPVRPRPPCPTPPRACPAWMTAPCTSCASMPPPRIDSVI